MYIAENQRLDLIVHPTIEALIQVKWIDFARYRCYFEMLQTLVDLVIWHLLGVLIPYNKKHVYNFPGDWWRLFLFIWAFLGIVRSVVGEIVELRNVSKYQKVLTHNSPSRERINSNFGLDGNQTKTSRARRRRELLSPERSTSKRILTKREDDVQEKQHAHVLSNRLLEFVRHSLCAASSNSDSDTHSRCE